MSNEKHDYPMSTQSSKRFVDLFAGLGGFHVGLSKLGHRCVFASELDPQLRELYERNFHFRPSGDIREVNATDIPNHEVLCAGFPCQPFSRAGKKKGAKCPSSGKLIDDVIRIIREKQPTYILLENVPEILRIEAGGFWVYIKSSLESSGYTVDHKIYTPQEFGIPQKRRRVFIVASKNSLSTFKWPVPEVQSTSLEMIIDNRTKTGRLLSKEKEHVLNKWQKFFNHIKEFSSLPILAAEFGATYPYMKRVRTVSEMARYKGAFGISMSGAKKWLEIRSHLPKHARSDNGFVGYRVAEAIEYSRDLYRRHEKFLANWKLGIENLPVSWTKMEWQGRREKPIIWEHLIQFRASGIRIIRPDSAPSLVAMTTTQIPILGPEKRYMNIREAAALQSLDELSHFPDSDSRAYKALGNAVNATIVSRIVEHLVH